MNDVPLGSQKYAKKCSYILQDDNLYPSFTVHETMLLAANLKIADMTTDEKNLIVSPSNTSKADIKFTIHPHALAQLNIYCILWNLFGNANQISNNIIISDSHRHWAKSLYFIIGCHYYCWIFHGLLNRIYLQFADLTNKKKRKKKLKNNCMFIVNINGQWRVNERTTAKIMSV